MVERMNIEHRTLNIEHRMKNNNKLPIIPALLQLFFCLVVLGIGAAIANHYLKTSPQAKPRKREPIPLVVQAESVKYSAHQVIINGMGTITPAQEITLTSQVSGEIIQISPDLIPGGLIKKGQRLLTIDPSDYQLTILQRKSDVAKAVSDLALEMGNQLIARKEFEILGEEATDDEKELMLREPQLDYKRATLKGAEAKLTQAELNLQRTRIDAPFNGVIMSRSVNLGSRISEATNLVQLAGTDEFWLKLSIPVDQLQWIRIPVDNSEPGPKVKIIIRESQEIQIVRMGRLLRLAPDLEEQGRMAVLYVSIRDPLAQLAENSERARLLIGSFVRAEIEGIPLQSAVAIKRSHIHDTNTLWLLSKDNTLIIREIDIAYKDRHHAFITSGIIEGEKIITSPLSAPVAGMSVKLWEPQQ